MGSRGAMARTMPSRDDLMVYGQAGKRRRIHTCRAAEALSATVQGQDEAH